MVLINCDIKKLKTAMLDFYNSTSININLLKADFTPFVDIGNLNKGYCKMIQNIAEGRKRCICSDELLLKKCRSSKKAEVHICHAGLVDVAVPVIYNDEIIAYMILGQMKKKEDFASVSGYISDLDADINKLKENYDIMPVYDEEFQKTATAFIKDVAKCGVDIILLEDDYRFGYFAGKEICCTCPLHMKKITEILNEEITPLELQEKVLNGGANKYRDAWMKANGDSLKNHARLLRNALNEVNPNIRIGVCSCMPLWDMDGVDTYTIARILAGDTKPYVRLIGAPYWAVDKFFGKSRLQNVIDLERMERSWTEDDLEIVAEGDCFPRPRTNCPSSYLELFDMAMRVEGKFSGIMKYSIDFISGPGYESGYVDAQIRNTHIYDEIEKYFSEKESCGIRIYESMSKFSDMYVDDKLKNDTNIYDTFFSPASRLLADNSIPSTFYGDGICGIAFGENIKYVPEEALKRGMIIDAKAAMILSSQGIDTGFESLGEVFPASTEYFHDYNITTGCMGRFSSYKCKVSKNTHISSSLIMSSENKTSETIYNPFTFRYENEKGHKFFIINLDTYYFGENMLRGYARSRQIAEAAEWMSGKKLPAYSYGNPDLYIMCKENTNKKAVGLFNIFADSIYTPIIELNEEYRSINFINCSGELKGNKVYLSEIPPFSFAGFEVEK